jgi:hypothetical protein
MLCVAIFNGFSCCSLRNATLRIGLMIENICFSTSYANHLFGTLFALLKGKESRKVSRLGLSDLVEVSLQFLGVWRSFNRVSIIER